MWLMWTLSAAFLLSDALFFKATYAAAVYALNETSNSSLYSASTGIDYSRGVSVNVPFSHEASTADGEESVQSVDNVADAQQSPLWDGGEGDGVASAQHEHVGERNGKDDGPPGADTDPHGFTIYNSLEQVPTARLLWRASKMAKCYTTRRGRNQCWTAYVCGHRCEPVLLAINSFCRRIEPHCSGDDGGSGKGDDAAMTTSSSSGVSSTETGGCSQNGRWIRCQKPRKFKRCYARVCFRRRGVGHVGPRPTSFEDPWSISIVRYHRPQPKHDLFAKRARHGAGAARGGGRSMVDGDV